MSTEALIHLFNQAQEKGTISGIQYHSSGPAINHLLFADDSLFICQASKPQCDAVLLCLEHYELMSGQQINKTKSAITFGSKVEEDIKDWIKMRTGIHLEGGTGKYLGLPECLSGSKQQLLGFIKERLQSKLTGWYAKTLSQGGKEILLKSVAMALPVYAMSCFKLPKSTTKALTSAMMDYWWNTTQSQQKIHWISHDKLTMPKSAGGFGFRDLELFNQALLAKQAWRLLHEPNCLFSRFFKSRYYRKTTFFESKLGSRPSYGWRSIFFGKNLLLKGLKRLIGNGKDTLVWIDKWIFDNTARRPIGIHSLMDITLSVSDLIIPSSGLWNVQMLRNLFHRDDVTRILDTRPLLRSCDSYCWASNRTGVYSVKSGYELIYWLENKDKFTAPSVSPSLFQILEECWKIKTAPKIQVFMWKSIKGAVAVSDRLQTRGIRIYDGCLLCGAEEETINHILFLCPYARQVWALSNVPIPSEGYKSTVHDNFKYLFSLRKNGKISVEIQAVFPWIIWFLWKNRNKLLFDGSIYPPELLIRQAYEDSTAWFLAQIPKHDETLMKLHQPSHWNPPLWTEVKCNIGFSWSKKLSLSGASWVVRDTMGNVLLHSRRSYAQVVSVFEAKLKSWEWALESMQSLNFKNVLFGASTYEVIQALHQPLAWPSLVSHLFPLLQLSQNKVGWQMVFEPMHCNSGASRIASSVITGFRLSSYVAQGAPSWLKTFFEKEIFWADSLSHLSLGCGKLPPQKLDY